ncbi:RNA polymerase sigma factor [Microbulbifer hydrolyticus]|uniref:DNA-directed RNA polymerase specialized sigma24 family protein n=1 Tax=Microbulbifer hydrolyticus TaxID=48074 RepID=A0A6P1T7H7_9GAMM|nr:sigma-70 family RNA polymerase sigma factor [Microbulbifer hydrolyticus]MBB5210786.1 DNA-directed RNA polymerase specialized sigma24 family protein [Microbulbifer hydrolyticus]QHQ38774.1 hypothetical protein GTQ55_07080 [Microbulbifer hydrolyticus]
MFAVKLCSLSDEDLVTTYCDTRNHKVFQEIYQRYKDELFRYCAQMAPQRCIPLMESLWGAFLKAPPKLHQHQLKNWLYIQINKRLRVPGSDEQVSTSNDASLREVLENSPVLKAIQQLPLRQRNVFLLFTECGLSLATAADIEQISLSACRDLLQKSREQIDHTVHGGERRPWKSAATLAREAAVNTCETGTPQTASDSSPQPAPKESNPVFPWGKSPNPAAAPPAAAHRSVEVA